VSKNFMDLGKRLNKAIPHLNHVLLKGALREYKIYGIRIHRSIRKDSAHSNIERSRYYIKLDKLLIQP
jgi:hypothetical protein